MIFLQYLTLFLNSHIRVLPQFLQWYSSSLSSSSAFPLNVFALQVFSVVILSLLVLSGWGHPEITLEFMLSFTTCIQPITATLALAQSLPPCPAGTSDLKLLLFSYFHPQFLFAMLTPPSLVIWLVIEPYQNICSFFIISYLCHLIYLSLLSLPTLSSSLFHVAT